MIRGMLYVYIIIVLLDAILSFFPKFDQEIWRKKFKDLANLSLVPIRKRLPSNLPFDFSPIILIIDRKSVV